ncbi:MAG: FAD-dependent oxidoreductase, partial [Coriobacteriales bacterium]
PTGVFYADPMHHPIHETRSFYERKAMGGAAVVTVGDAMVDGKHACHGQFEVEMDDPDLFPSLNRLAMDISRHNAIPSLEMFHGGNAAAFSYYAGNEIYGPQEETIVGALGQPPTHVTAMNRQIMDEVIQKHVDAAKVAKNCGFKMIMLHAAHGFLLHQFMSPTLNRRTDEYGGTFENRLRFPLEVVRAVREAVGPDFPIEMRISGSEVFEGGYGIDYGCKIAEAFDGIVDIIHVSCGSHEDASVFTVTHPSMFLEDGVNVKYAAEVKKHVKKSYVATVGALSDPRQMEEIIASGKADIVELARGLICDPDIPNKAREGREDEIRHCCRCLTCFSNLIVHGQIPCALNPEIGDAMDHMYARPEAKHKSVLVVGGGIAGMEAAITCAERGHEVVLCEKSSSLGGVMNCEKDVPFKKHVAEYLELQEKRIYDLAIPVRLDTEVTPEVVADISPDVIIAALGASPSVPPIPGIENALSAIDVYADPDLAGDTVAILGGGLVGAELAIYLSDLGKKASIIEMLPNVNVGDNILHGMALGIELEKHDIEMHMNAKVKSISNGVVSATVKDEEGNTHELTVEADTIVNALGMKRNDVEGLRFCAPEFHQIGSCNSVGTIYDATRVAHTVALDIGQQ